MISLLENRRQNERTIKWLAKVPGILSNPSADEKLSQNYDK